MSFGSVVDLRSDTVTRPTPGMYAAMATAPLGDDVLGDDPTVHELEQLAAEMTGKEAALFVASGTMGNQICIAAHCKPGDSILVEEESHILYYELGGPAVHAGAVTLTLPSVRGTMDPELVRRRVLKASDHTPGSTLLCIENTHNRAGGAIVPMDTIAEYRAICDDRGLKMHMDGARAFNAVVALGVPIPDLFRPFDSASFCLSKGLRSPIGSIVVGSKAFVDRTRPWRKRLGGGLRQSGILAACGIVSLTTMVDRLVEDHRRAKHLAMRIATLPGLNVDVDQTETNIVLVHTAAPAKDWQTALGEHGVACFAVDDNRLRLVLHADVDDCGIERALEAFSHLATKHSS